MIIRRPVEVEVLESEDVQHSDGLSNVARIAVHLVDDLVDLVDQPDKHASVDALHQRVSHVHRGLGVQRFRHALATRLDRLHRQSVIQTCVVHLTTTTNERINKGYGLFARAD